MKLVLISPEVSVKSNGMLRRWCLNAAISMSILLLPGCLGRQDRWRHYASGGAYQSQAPSMSPTDGSIVFSSPRTGHGDIYLWDPTTAEPRRLTKDPDFDTSPLFSPDGKRIAFERETDGYSHIYLADPKTGEEKQLTFDPTVDSALSFSPDSKSLIIRRGRYTGGLGLSAECAVIDIDAGRQAVAAGFFAAFGPNGQVIYYAFYDQGTHRDATWAMDRNGSDRHRVCDGYVLGVFPDGKLLIGKTGQPLEVFSLVTKQRRTLLGTEGAQPTIASDGSHLLFTREYGRTLWRIGVIDGILRQLDGIPAHVEETRACKGGFLLVVAAGDDRCGDVYFLEMSKWVARKLFSVAQEKGTDNTKVPRKQ